MTDFFGNDFDNQILSGGISSDSFFLMGGDDFVVPGGGSDTIFGGSGHDTLSYRNSPSSVVVNLAKGSGSDGYANGDQYESIEEVEGSDFDDTLIGGNQFETLFGGLGDDTFHGSFGFDSLNGGEGFDTVSYSNSSNAVLVALDHSNANGAGIDQSFVNFAVGDTYTSIEGVVGSDHNDTLVGTEDNNRIDGGRGDDFLSGQAGDGTLVGKDGDDTLFGGTGSDVMSSGSGSDYLDGGTGADAMKGGQGNDFYIVDNIGDEVIGEVDYSLGGGIDTVRAFIDYIQPNNIELVRLGNITDIANLNAIGNDAPGTLVGNAGDNILIGRGGNDQLNGNDGDDTITGNTGRDTLVGGAGADTFIYTSISESRAGSDNRDVVNGFTHGSDQIDLAGIDANTGTFGVDDAFAFIGSTSFSGTAGELRTQSLGGPNAVLVEGDINGDAVADFQIFVNLTTAMHGTDFVL